jgi:hypothetical protein
VAQYPARRMRQFSTRVMRFLDGSEQRFRVFGAALKKWTIPLALLDDAELAQVVAFFAERGGRAGTFSFTDPWDGTVYPDCSFDEDLLEAEFGGADRGRTSVTIRENRS